MGLLNIKNILQFSSEVEQNIDDNNDFLGIDPKMSMMLILWSSERLVVHPWLQWTVSMVLALPAGIRVVETATGILANLLYLDSMDCLRWEHRLQGPELLWSFSRGEQH